VYAPKIADFGLAKRLGDESGQTQHGTIVGTPSYMAPEQVPDAATGWLAEVGPAADVYALGAVLYDALVGRPPFKGTTVLDTVEQVRKREPIPPRQLQPHVPRDLETICLKCLQKAPTRRYATALALADDLRRFLDGEPIEARATPALERAAKWARRKPAIASLLAVGLVAVLALVMAVGLYVRGLSQQLEAEEQKRRTQTQIAETRARAQQHEIGKNWRAALAELRNAQELLKLQPELGTAQARDEIRQRLDDLEQRIAEEDQGHQAKKRARGFHPLRDEALFFATVFTGLDPLQNRNRLLAASREALAIYRLAVEVDGAGGPPVVLDADRKYLEAAEHSRLVAACYELLLIWADAEATAPPGQGDSGEASRARAEKALKLLGLASRLSEGLGRNTRTFHRYEARFLAQSQGKPFDAAAADQDAPAAAARLDWFLAGMEWYRHERWADAIEACAQVLQKHPDDYWAHYLTALSQLRLGDWANARAELTTCLNLKQDFLWPQLLRGFTASEMGFKQKDARLQLADFSAAEQDFNAVLERDASKLAQYVGLANRGVLNIRRRRWDAAFQDLEAAVKVDANGIEAYLNLAVAHQGLGQWQQALEALNKAEKLAPYLPAIYESRARLHLKRGDWQAARADFEQAIAREPKGSRSARLAANLMEQGKLLDRAKNYPAALVSYDTALRVDPELGLAHRFRAETLLRMDRLTEAGNALDEYLKKARQVPANVYYARGLVYAQAKKPMQAIEMYTLGLAQAPDDADIRRQRGWAYLQCDAANLALEDFDTCLQDRKDDLDALIGRGSARMRLRKLPEALEDARAAQQRGSLSDRQSYHLARLYGQAAGQLESATGLPAQKAAAWQLAGVKEEALDCLQHALQQLPAEKRASFWRQQVQTDPAFAALRATDRYVSLALFFAANAPRSVGDTP
jgi:eukaryotic-like serine/threonine-protein kinase